MIGLRAFVLVAVVATCSSFPTPEDKSTKSVLQTQTINFSDHLSVRCHTQQALCDAVCGRLTSFNEGISSVGIHIPFLDNMVKSVVQGMCPSVPATDEKVEGTPETPSQPEVPAIAVVSNPESPTETENASSPPQSPAAAEVEVSSSTEEVTNNETI